MSLVTLPFGGTPLVVPEPGWVPPPGVVDPLDPPGPLEPGPVSLLEPEPELSPGLVLPVDDVEPWATTLVVDFL